MERELGIFIGRGRGDGGSAREIMGRRLTPLHGLMASVTKEFMGEEETTALMARNERTRDFMARAGSAQARRVVDSVGVESGRVRQRGLAMALGLGRGRGLQGARLAAS